MYQTYRQSITFGDAVNDNGGSDFRITAQHNSCVGVVGRGAGKQVVMFGAQPFGLAVRDGREEHEAEPRSSAGAPRSASRNITETPAQKVCDTRAVAAPTYERGPIRVRDHGKGAHHEHHSHPHKVRRRCSWRRDRRCGRTPLMFLGAGTAQATQDDPGFKLGIHDVGEMPIRCQSRLVLCAGPQPDPPGIALPGVQMIGPYGPGRAVPEFGHAVQDAEPPPSPRS